MGSEHVKAACKNIDEIDPWEPVSPVLLRNGLSDIEILSFMNKHTYYACTPVRNGFFYKHVRKYYNLNILIHAEVVTFEAV